MNEEQIYSTVPLEMIEKVDSSKKLEIVHFLKANKEICFTAKSIAQKCGFPNKGTHIEVRRAITELIECNGASIIATSKGFCWTDELDKLIEYSTTLNLRKLGLERRIKAIERLQELNQLNQGVWM